MRVCAFRLSISLFEAIAAAAAGVKPSEIFSNLALSVCACLCPTVCKFVTDSWPAFDEIGVYSPFILLGLMNNFFMALSNNCLRSLLEFKASGFVSSYVSICFDNKAII